MSRRRPIAVPLVVALLTGALIASAPPAAAQFHLMKIEEVDTGHEGDATEQYVNLQMYAAGQHLVGGHFLRVYAADGSAQDCTIPGDVMVGTDQSHVLIAATNPIHGVIPDFLLPQPTFQGSGGALCFEGIDCVSWGSFSGTTLSPAGTPFPTDFSGTDQAIVRKTDIDMMGGSLGPNDDTNDSATDFTLQPHSPENNSPSASATPMTCQPVPVTTPPPGGDEEPAPSLVGLKTKVKGARAIVRGRIEPPAPGDKVQLAFFANGSPLRKIAKGKATLNDDSRFKKRLKIPADATRCRVVVRFGGSRVGKKTFRC